VLGLGSEASTCSRSRNNEGDINVHQRGLDRKMSLLGEEIGDVEVEGG